MQDERHDFAGYEFFLERCAIREVDGGLKPFSAEGLAAIETQRYCRKHGISEPMDTRYRLLAKAYEDDGRAGRWFDTVLIPPSTKR